MRKSNVVPPKLRESSLDRSNKVASLRVDDIDVKTNPLRPLDEEKVKLIAASMARLGLMLRSPSGITRSDRIFYRPMVRQTAMN